jgi:catechol 2,3-dioxygenase-like lactoylglutathione lyase family enzyme
MTKPRAVLNQVNLVVGDMKASADFYRRLGADVAAPETGAYHLACGLANDLDLDLDTAKFAAVWNRAWAGRADLVGRTVLGFAVETREAVDALHADMVGAGYRSLQPPWDAFWGARYAIIEDPNGAAVGLMSPVDPAKRYWPPEGWTG